MVGLKKFSAPSPRSMIGDQQFMWTVKCWLSIVSMLIVDPLGKEDVSSYRLQNAHHQSPSPRIDTGDDLFTQVGDCLLTWTAKCQLSIPLPGINIGNRHFIMFMQIGDRLFTWIVNVFCCVVRGGCVHLVATLTMSPHVCDQSSQIIEMCQLQKIDSLQG